MSPSATYCPFWGWSGHRYTVEKRCQCGAFPPLEDIVEIAPDVIDRAVDELGVD